MSILAKKNEAFAQAQDDLAKDIREGGPFLLAGNGTSRIGLAEGATLPKIEDAWDYDPAALTLTVASGVSVEEITKLLAKESQRLSFEPPDMSGLMGRTGAPTIGGVVAGNLSGPRRVGVGACRDFCLGVSFIDGRGEIIKNGGRVMKNVTGLDLVKLMAGSHGTLGLITEVSLKVAPIPEVMQTLVIEGLQDAEAVAALSKALGQPFDVTGAAHLPADAGGMPARTLIRLEGFENSVAYRMQRLRIVLADFGAGTEVGQVIADPAETDHIWRDIRDVTRFHAASGDVWRISVQPSKAAALVDNFQPEDVIYDWGGNRLWLLMAEGTDVRAKMAAAFVKGHATLIRASDETKRALGVFHPEPPVMERISAGLRQKFDPEQKFNRGMMG